jgi:transcriptional regulator with XRE-family HTH domain
MTNDETSLGGTIRAWRDRLAPSAAGLPSGRARRTAGLRREELADLAGVSVDYVVRLEQGRATTPSAQVAGALARALQLTRAERDHLYRLAGLQPPGDGRISDHIPPGTQRVLARLGDIPVGVFAADWRLIWWNRGWAALLGDPSPLSPDDRNLVRSRFPAAADSARVARWPVVSTITDVADLAIVADLRRASARYPADPRLAALIRQTLDGSPRFAELWHSGAVGAHAEDRKTISHPAVGEITVDCDVLAYPDTDLKIVIYTATPGSEDEAKIELARVAGIVGPFPLPSSPAAGLRPPGYAGGLAGGGTAGGGGATEDSGDSTARTSRPATSAQNAAPIPRKLSPEAATTKVIAAASRPSVADRAPAKDAESVPRSASPATAPVTSAGAALTNVVRAAASRASTR